MCNKMLLWEDNLFQKSTAYWLILNMSALKHQSWIDLLLEFTPETRLFYREVTDNFATRTEFCVQHNTLISMSHNSDRRLMDVKAVT